MYKIYKYQVNLSKDEFYSKIKNHIAYNQNRHSYEDGYEFYTDDNSIENLKLTSVSDMVMTGAFIPSICIKLDTVASDLTSVSLIISLSKLCYFFFGLFDFMSIVFGIITYTQTLNCVLSLVVGVSFLLITNLIYFFIIKKYINDAKERFENILYIVTKWQIA